MYLDPAQVAVIILNFKGGENTLACLRALERMSDHAGLVVIVDNNSQDGSLEAIRQWLTDDGRSFFCAAEDGLIGKEFPEGVAYALLPLSRNDGYAAGNNAGAKFAMRNFACRAFWILNNDTEPQSGALAALCRCLNNEPAAGMAGSTLVYACAPDRLQCAGGYSLNRLFGTTSPVCGGEALREVLSRNQQQLARRLDYISGASLFVRREGFEELGGLTEEYFLYYEDADFGVRARHKGYELAWAQDSLVVHKEGGSSGATAGVKGRAFSRPLLVDYLSLRNRAYLVRTHFPWAQPIAFLGFLGAFSKRVLRGQIRRIPLLCQAVWHGFSGRLGIPNFSLFSSKA